MPEPVLCPLRNSPYQPGCSTGCSTWVVVSSCSGEASGASQGMTKVGLGLIPKTSKEPIVGRHSRCDGLLLLRDHSLFPSRCFIGLRPCCDSQAFSKVRRGSTKDWIPSLTLSTRPRRSFGSYSAGVLCGLFFRGLRGLRKLMTSLLTSAYRSMKTRCPALSRRRSLASGMASASATALANGT